jgi:hypothetical protein
VMMLFVMLLVATDNASAESCIYISGSPWLNHDAFAVQLCWCFEFLFSCFKMDGRCGDECKVAAMSTGGSVSFGCGFAMNEDRLLLLSESNLMILAMLDARLVAAHHVCHFISVQTLHHRQIPMAHLLNMHTYR